MRVSVAWILPQPLFVPYSSMEAIASMSSAHRYIKPLYFWKVATFLDLCRRFPYPPLPASHTLSGGETTGLPRALIGCGERNVTTTSPPLVERGPNLFAFFFFFFPLVAICRPVATATFSAHVLLRACFYHRNAVLLRLSM